MADEAYGPDQWQAHSENPNVSYSRRDGRGVSGITAHSIGRFTASNGDKFMVAQPLEGIVTNPILGRTVRLQAKLRANTALTFRIGLIELQNAGTQDTIPSLVSAWNADSTDPTLGTNLAFIGAESKSVTTEFQEFSFSATLPANSQNIIVAIWTDAGLSVNDYLEMTECGLYLGDFSRSWNPRPPQQELELAARYYHLGHAGAAFAPNGGSPTAGSTGFTFRTSMRVAPTLGEAVVNQDGTTSRSFSSIDEYGCRYNITTNGTSPELHVVYTGRAGFTALNALCLEVYYRYLPVYR